MPRPIPELVEIAREHGGSLTTDGQELRVRWFKDHPPAWLASEIRVRRKELYRFLMEMEP